MKRILGLTLLAASVSAFAQTYVPPHVNSNGTVTQGYYRSEPNSIRMDNYGAKDNVYGNTNPYTGQRGSQRSELSTPPAYNNPNPYGQGNSNNVYNAPRRHKF